MLADVRFHTSFGPLLLGLLSRSESRVEKKPWEESNVLILTAMLWSIDSFKNSVTVSRAQVSNALRKEGNKEEKQNQHPLTVID